MHCRRDRRTSPRFGDALDRRQFAAEVAYIAEKSLYERVESISAPATIVFGELDQRIDPAGLCGYASTKSDIVRIADASHTPAWEAPEQVAAVVRNA